MKTLITDVVAHRPKAPYFRKCFYYDYIL